MGKTISDPRFDTIIGSYLHEEWDRVTWQKTFWDGAPYVDTINWSNTKYSESVPGYRSLIRNRKSATSHFHGTKLRGTRANGYYLVTYEKDWFYLHTRCTTMHNGMMLGFTKPPINAASYVSVGPSKADAIALQQLVKKARAAQSYLSGGTVIGELRETLRMIRHPAKALWDGVHSYHKDVKKRLRRARNNRSGGNRLRKLPIHHRQRIVQDTWLEYSFGWAPFVSDVLSAVDYLESRRDFRSDQIRVKGYGSESAQSYGEVVRGQWYNLFMEYYPATRDTIEIIYRGAVKREVNNDFTANRQMLGLTWSEVLPTAWELIPYSFLVDYFTNIGDIVSAFSFHRSDFAWINRTDRWIIKKWRDRQALTSPKLGQNIWNSYSVVTDRVEVHPTEVWESIEVNRDKYNGSIIPDFRFEIPGVGSMKWLNIASLIKLRR